MAAWLTTRDTRAARADARAALRRRATAQTRNYADAQLRRYVNPPVMIRIVIILIIIIKHNDTDEATLSRWGSGGKRGRSYHLSIATITIPDPSDRLD